MQVNKLTNNLSFTVSQQVLAWPGSAVYQWTWLDTRRGLNTALETDESQSKDSEYSKEGIYSGSDQVYNTRDEKWWQRGQERHEVAGRGECQASAVGFAHFILWIEEFLFDQTVGGRSEFYFIYFEFELKAF